MVTMTLEEKEVRDLVKALSVYREEWEGKITSIKRRIRLIDSHTCKGRQDIEEMTVDLQIAESYLLYLDAFRARLIERIR